MAFGHQAAIRDALAVQERLDSDLEVVYSEASGRTIEQVRADLLGPHGDGTRFSADEALAAGYVSEVIRHNKQRAAVAMAMAGPLAAARLRLFDAGKAVDTYSKTR